MHTLPRNLRHFVAQHFLATEDIEVLLLLWRDPSVWWTSTGAANALNLADSIVRPRLEQLSGRFLEVRVTADVRFRFSPGNMQREKLVADLATAYRERRMDVVAALVSGRSARHFADAFRLKREEADE